MATTGATEMMRVASQARRQCPQNPLHLDILWLPRAAMKTVETDTSDCVLVVGVSRPKMAAALLTVMLLSLFVTFHVLYDSAVYSLQTVAVGTQEAEQHQQYTRFIASASIADSRQRSSSSSSQKQQSDDNFIDNNNAIVAADGTVILQNSNVVVIGDDERNPSSSADNQDDDLDDNSISPNRARDGIVRVHFPRTSRRLPQAIIIGVRKCGTRALLEMLYLHPMIQKAAGEVHFFDRDDNYRKGLEWYRKKMPHSFRGQITIEKSPSYFVTPEVPERIRAMNASVKLLLIVREPVTRAISDYTQLRSHAAATASPPSLLPPIPALGSTSISTTASGTASSSAATSLQQQQQQQQQQQKSFEQLALLPDGTVNEAYKPLAISMYHTFMHRWLEVFPREQILIVNGDMLIEDPVPQLQRIEHFLGIEPRIGKHNFYFNETKGFFCLRNDTADKCLRETKGRRHPRVDPYVISKLRRFFSEHNQKFYELVGEDFGWPEE